MLAIDELHRLLRGAGGRDLQNESICDRRARVRLILRTPTGKTLCN
ncbi:hypothetical protein [Ensifer adhaerens]|nr:hypothetical protein [Ensifer adhaerens]